MPSARDDDPASPSPLELRGRVLRRDDVGTLLLDEGSRTVSVRGACLDTLLPGDLARLVAAEPVDGAFTALAATLVHRPTRSPFARGSETFRLGYLGVAGRLEARAAVREAVRGYFASQGFVEVETPSTVPCPGLDVHLSAFAVRRPEDGALEGWLATSPELHLKRLVAGGMHRVVELARCHRAGERGRRHEPEFTMLEWYRGWAGLDDVLRDTECVLRAAAEAAASPGMVTMRDAQVSLDADFERVTVREAFARFAPDVDDPIALAERDEAEYFRRLSVDVEPRLGSDAPVFLTRFPARHASLARLADDDRTVCLRAELYVAGVELCNAFDELTDPTEQRARFARDQAHREAIGLPVYPVDEAFLAALDEGLPPSAGNAVGFDRLVAVVTGSASLAEVMAFPKAG